MDSRYLLPEMKKLWSMKSKFAFWLKVELAVLRVRVILGLASKLDVAIIEKIEKLVVSDVERIDEIGKKPNMTCLLPSGSVKNRWSL